MKDKRVKDIRQFITVEAVVVMEDATIQEIIKIFIENPVTRAAYVVNKKDILEGIITVHDILKKVSIDFFSLSSFYSDSSFSGYKIASTLQDSTAKDLMNPEVYFVHDDDPVEKAFNLLFQHHAGEIPVVDDKERIIGDLNIIELLVFWNEKNREYKE